MTNAFRIVRYKLCDDFSPNILCKYKADHNKQSYTMFCPLSIDHSVFEYKIFTDLPEAMQKLNVLAEYELKVSEGYDKFELQILKDSVYVEFHTRWDYIEKQLERLIKL